MGDKQIGVGDLAVVIKPNPHCGCPDKLGRYLRVTHICPGKKYRICDTCGAKAEGGGWLIAEFDGGRTIGLDRIKRVPPPDELGIVDEKEDLREPA